jgi:hypothetical protein
MSISVYDQTVTALSHTLRALDTILAKAIDHAQASGYDVNVLAVTRVFPDMHPFVRQVQLATDFAKGGAARLAGVELPKWDDTETTFDELRARVAKALAFLATLTPAQFEGAEERRIEIKTPSRSFSFVGRDFLLHWVIPNVYFHCTAVYLLLRHNGVPVGKLDFLGPL